MRRSQPISHRTTVSIGNKESCNKSSNRNNGSSLNHGTKRQPSQRSSNSTSPTRSRNINVSSLLVAITCAAVVLCLLHYVWDRDDRLVEQTYPRDQPHVDHTVFEISARRSNEQVQPPPPLLLVSNNNHDKPKALSQMECGIPHSHLSDAFKVSGSVEPVLLTGWEIPADMASPDAFLAKYGKIPFYIKDTAVQIQSNQCVLPFETLWDAIISTGHTNALAFTNNQENPALFEQLSAYNIPAAVQHINGFAVLSTLTASQSHPFHKHGESWIAAAAGYKVWWFLPPTARPPVKVNACDYLTGTAEPPAGTVSCVQSPGSVIWFPENYYRATCSLSEWTVGIGAQQGPLIRQQFPVLPAQMNEQLSQKQIEQRLQQCLPKSADADWKWYNGNLTAYYNDLEEQDHQRNPDDISKYAVHRWMGPTRSTLEHYKLIHQATHRYAVNTNRLRVTDAGCGLGSALMWMEQHEPTWKLTGYTLSDRQLDFIRTKLPEHKFSVALKSYNELNTPQDVIYSIEAMIHSENITKTMQVWAEYLDPEGSVIIIDDFLSPGVDRNDPIISLFCKSWLANSLVTVTELHGIARKFGLELVESRDLVAEYRIVELNYRNSIPKMNPDKKKNHQGWMGSKLRQKLTVEGKLGYNMVVFRKMGKKETASPECTAVPSSAVKPSNFKPITSKDECLSGWYCCNQADEFFKRMNADRTHNYGYLKLDPSLFGDYSKVFANHLNNFYETLPADYTGGRFLDIGATGSTTSGMKQVTTKFQHFAGPLEYWMLDSDAGAKDLDRTIYCDVCDCQAAESCGYDVTFSHTVLEHASHPDLAFDTVARVTKKGGLTMHLVPWSYQYHATPDDFYRFSHSALKVLLEDRGFEVYEVGYDICSKPDRAKNNIDEHYDLIWLTYVVGRKK